MPLKKNLSERDRKALEPTETIVELLFAIETILAFAENRWVHVALILLNVPLLLYVVRGRLQWKWLQVAGVGFVYIAAITAIIMTNVPRFMRFGIVYLSLGIPILFAMLNRDRFVSNYYQSRQIKTEHLGKRDVDEPKSDSG